MTPTTNDNEQVQTVEQAQATKDTVYINERPAIPAETDNVKYEIRVVSRTIKGANGETVRAKHVLVPIAKTVEGALEISQNDQAKLLSDFNTGHFSVMRAEASNEVAGGSEADRAFAKSVKALSKLPIFAGKSEDEVSEILRNNPAFITMFATK